MFQSTIILTERVIFYNFLFPFTFYYISRGFNYESTDLYFNIKSILNYRKIRGDRKQLFWIIKFYWCFDEILRYLYVYSQAITSITWESFYFFTLLSSCLFLENTRVEPVAFLLKSSSTWNDDIFDETMREEKLLDASKILIIFFSLLPFNINVSRS